jgi:glycosyltransferase involved in cell wall biosynthesis
VLIEALGILSRLGRPLTATIVGTGPAWTDLVSLTNARGLSANLRFVGQVTGPALAEILNQHRILAVPSVYYEAFGVVALEAIACGCAVVASDTGGLPEAVGSCGVTFPPGDAALLAKSLSQLLDSPARLADFQSHAPSHLARHHPDKVAENYLRLLKTLPPAGPIQNGAPATLNFLVEH